MRTKPKGINYKLFKVMGIQLALISIVTLLSVYGAAKVVEDVLIKEALDGEAEYFWQDYSKDSTTRLPRTLNLTGYFSDSENIPEVLQSVSVGYHRVSLGDDNPLVHVSRRYGKTLILVFKEGQVARLAFYFGIAPLAFVLLIIYLPAWVSFVMSKRAMSPVVRLAKKVDDIQISRASDILADFGELERNADAEVLTLIKAFEHYSKEVNQYVRREEEFSRYASHELRTPLAVMKGSIALLAKKELDDANTKIIIRMAKVTDDMERLIDALLLLSRNKKAPSQIEPVELVEILQDEIKTLRDKYPTRELAIKVATDNELYAKVPQYLFTICISNLLNNAVNYDLTGNIQVSLYSGYFEVKDSGKGMTATELEKIYQPFYRGDEFRDSTTGFGLGLAIVKTICERMGWLINISSEVNKGTTVRIDFNLQDQ